MVDKNNGRANGRLKRIGVLIFCLVVAIATAIACVFCFAPAKKVGVEGVDGGEVVTSTTATYSTANQTYDFTTGSGNIANNKAGRLVNGDILNFSYSGGKTTITLPKGTYKLEVWGAQGGQGRYDYLTANPGKGGYSYGTINLTSASNAYVYPGGQGSAGLSRVTGAPVAGGFNGGGNSGYNGSSNYNNGGGSGGGGTDIRIGTDSLYARVIVAGGGGAGGNSWSASAANGGAGGGASGQDGTSGGTSGVAAGSDNWGAPGGGGKATSGGVAGRYSSISVTANPGTFGVGGSGYTGNKNSAGGGGGGGWYGGGAGCQGHSAGSGAGGGGSGYVYTSSTAGNYPSGCKLNSSHYLTSAATSAGSASFTAPGGGNETGHAGHGYARITVINVNREPTVKPYTSNNRVLGTLSTPISISASTLAVDDQDGSDQTAAQKTVYFANSTTDMSFTANNTTNLYANAACTTNLRDYIDYQFINNTTLQIKNFKKLPRAGVSGYNISNNSLTVYAVLRDNYNSSTLNQCAYCVTPLTFNFTKSTITHGSNTSGVTSGGNSYRFGDNSTMDSSTVASGGIYSKTQAGRFALTVKSPIKRGDAVTITAAGLLTGFDTNKYTALMVPSAAPSGAPYSITLNAADKVTFSDWNGTSATDTNSGYTSRDGYTKITINGVNANRDWQTLNVTLYVVETSTKQEPAQITYTGGYASDSKQLLELNFKCDNTRPVLRDAPINCAPAVINVELGKQTTVNINNYFRDEDDGNIISAATHSVQSVIVPSEEFVEVDKYDNVKNLVNVAGATDGKSYYNIGGSLTGTHNSARSDTPTGFNQAIASTTADPNAFVSYSFSGISVTFTGLRSSYSQYDPTRTNKKAYTGGTVSSPSGSADVANPGHFYLLIQIRDNNEADDTGIYLPLAITVGASDDDNAKPKGTNTALHSSSGQGAPVSVKPTADGNPDDVFRFTPMAVNIGGTLKPIGKYMNGSALSDTDLQPLAIDADNFATADGLSNRSDIGWSGKLNEFLTLNNVTANSIYTSIGANASQYVTVSLIDIYVPQSYFGGRVVVGDTTTPGVNSIAGLEDGGSIGGISYYKTKGIEIELESSTMNRFVHATVDIADSSVNNRPTSHVEVDIAIRVTNKAPKVLNADKIAKPAIGQFGGVTYTAPKEIVSDDGKTKTVTPPTITYKVPAHTTFMITPYDLIYDPDMYVENGESKLSIGGGFTLNGFGGVYDNGKFIQGADTKDYSGGIEVSPLFDTAAYGTGNAAYLNALKSMLAATDSTRSIKKTANENTFISSVDEDEPMFNDKLYFLRTDYNAIGDAYTFNPTTCDFYIDSRNTTNYVEWKFGNSINVDGTKANMDFVLVQAKSRTSVAAELELIVRDRYGSTDSGVGTRIKIVIEIINTAPELKKLSAVELAVKPITQSDDQGEHIVTPNEFPIGVNTVMSDKDTDPISYITANGVLVANTPDLATLCPEIMDSFDNVPREYLVDYYDSEKLESGNLLSEKYVKAGFNGANLVVSALNSTKNIENGVYVYFFATDKKVNGDALGYIQVEVLNSAPEMNREENGFDETNIWKVTSTSGADISRSRYIVGSEVAYNESSKLGAVPADVKLIASDVDALQRGVMLSPRGAKSYINLVGDVHDYEYAVPNFTKDINGIPTSGNDPYAVAAYMTDSEGGKASVPDNFTIELNYYVNSKWYTRDELVLALTDGEIEEELCFDDHGRWTVVDWALRLRATAAFESGDVLALELSLRDEACFGGDTAGEKTAYSTNRKLPAPDNKIIVSGKLAKDPIVFLSISGTGISTKDMYAQYNNYYVVEVDKTVGEKTDTTAYISTYDGKTDSVYTADDNATPIAYNTVNSKNVLSSSGTTQIKGASGADGTKAGTNSGKLFSDAIENAHYLKGAYKYPDKIVIPGTNDALNKSRDTVYVPMSFFGMLKTFVSPDSSTGAVTYLSDYVGYDVRTGSADVSYNKGNIEEIKSAITLTDSNGGRWSGADLNNNPYITIGAVDYTATKTGADYFGNENSIAYYNKCIGTNTVDADGFLLGYEKNDSGNHNSFVGNGEIMYLENQTTELKEHNFGLSFVKKNMRTTDDITLTVKLAKSSGGKTTVCNATTGVPEEQNFRSVSVKIRVENGMFDLVEKGELQYEEKSGTYFVDVSMSSDATKTFALMRDGHDSDGIENNTNEIINATKIFYTDTDYDGAKYKNGVNYRDYAFFSGSSFNSVSSWDGSLSRKYSGEGAAAKLVNTVPDERAQKSILNYYGVQTVDSYEDDDGAYKGLDTVTSAYQPNPGKYGSNNGTAGSGMSGYGSYFTATSLGRTLTFTSIKKTYINEEALKSIATSAAEGFNYGWNDANGTYGGLTQKQLSAIYLSRGLVVDYNTPDESAEVKVGAINKVYYPFRTLVYDSALDDVSGWGEASYAAIEFRIEVYNAKAKLKTDLLKKVGEGDAAKYYYDILLSVGSTIEVNLYNFVEDPDIIINKGEDLTLATRTDFVAATGVELETADYLESMFKYTDIGDATGKQEAGGGGSVNALSKSDSKYYDVIMSMPTGVSSLDASTSPQSNHLQFTVNRRTTVKDGNSISDKTKFEFTVKFCDNHGVAAAEYTDEITFRIEVQNQAPWVETNVREVKMRSGDSVTLLTSFYDTFIGGVDGGSDAYNNSATKNQWGARGNKDVDRPFDLDGDKTTENGVEKNAGWDFTKITESEWSSKFKPDTSKEYGDGMHLGFIGICNDDTPWKLRIRSYPESSPLFTFYATNIMPVEGTHYSGRMFPTALTIVAKSAVERFDFRVTIIDGDGKEQTYTLRISVVSNAPIALDPENENDKHILEEAGLAGVVGSGGYIDGTYRMFVKPYSDAEVDVDGFGKVQARHSVTINASDVAKDLDTGETSKMTFYKGGGFSVDNVVLSRDMNSSVYHARYFDLDVETSRFTLTCTGYNPDKEYESLSFSIGDPGDATKYVNITIQVYTVYADITNETVARYNTDAYKEYLNGSNVVNVKSADKYNGRGKYDGDETVLGKESKYAYMKFDRVTGTDGNNDSPIDDPDINVADKQTYAVNLYAFIDNNGDALTKEQLEPLFARSSATNTFLLKSRSGSAGEGLGDITDYLIGGVDVNNRNISATTNAVRKLAIVRSYVDFSFDQYGTSVMFAPKTATLDTKLMLYIEVQKPLGSRGAKRTDGIIFGGTLFRLQVEDSAPIAVNASGQEAYDVAVSGAKGDYIKLKIFDAANGGGTLFTDTDIGDVVSIGGFDPLRDTDADYREALKRALAQDASLDWNSDSAKGKSRAFDIEINNTEAQTRTSDAPKDVNDPHYNDDRYILEPHTLRIVINRRMDKVEGGKYANEVTFPIVLKGKDTSPASDAAEVVINLTVKNTPIDAVDSYSHYDYDPVTQLGSGMGYSFAHDETDPDLYVINASVAPHESLTIRLTDFIVDADYTANGDTDSFRFVNGKDQNPYLYLTNAPIEIKHYTNIEFDEGDVLASVTPMRSGDVNHMTGFTITAESTARAKTATFYLRVIDRSGDENAKIGDDLYTEGVWIRVNVTLLNARPELIPSMRDVPIVVLGSNREAITYGPFSIGDFVTDENDTDVVGDEASALNPDTYLRISSTNYQLYDSLYSTIDTTIGGGNDSGSDSTNGGANNMSSALFELTPASGGYNQTFTITTRVGYYGVGAFDITVSDGNFNVRDDTLSVTFSVRVEVVYDPDELPALNGVTLAACKTTSVTIESLIPQIDNVLNDAADVEQSAYSAVADPKAAGKFEPSRDYVLLNVEPSEEAKQYVEIEHEADSFAWTVRALKRVTNEPKRINVTYALKSDPEETYENSFLVTVLENKRPELIYSEITFIRYVDETESDAFMLNTSNTAYLRADQLLRDPENDVMRFDSVKSQKPSLIGVELSENRQMIGITFNARGKAEITVSVIDETGDAVSRTFLVINNDLPEPSLWMRITSSFESNKVLWAVIIGCVVLLVIILIIIIAVRRKKKREREELEALLVSEMEIEEQMYKLAGGPSPTGYQSFGYLQSAPGQTPDPSMMLGAGGGGQVTPPELALPPAQDGSGAQQPQQGADNQRSDGYDDFDM